MDALKLHVSIAINVNVLWFKCRFCEIFWSSSFCLRMPAMNADVELSEYLPPPHKYIYDPWFEKAGFPVGRDTIKALIMDVFAAGIDTTYTVLEWAMTELLRHPLVMKQLQAEVRGIVGTREEISESDLEEMKYLKAVMKETLRLHPPIPLLVPRELNGYDISAGTRVFINAWAIHTDPVHWEEPEKFRPERFLDSSVDFKGQDFPLIPFGAGRRGCPGISFAVANNEFVLANLMHRFDWALTAATEGATLDMSETAGLTAHRKNPLITVATPYRSF
ncbi:hypothetical protein Dimus_004674 [Dionaea muscipula]